MREESLPAPPPPLIKMLRRQPLIGFYVMAFAFTWIWDVLAFEVWHLDPLSGGLAPGPFLGPTLAAFVMTASIDGKRGVLRLLRRYVLWRVPIQWYVAVLLGMPTLTLLSVLTLPGALSTFQTPPPALVFDFVPLFFTIFVFGGPLGEEPGWRGFALPRFQERHGPLLASLFLGVLWGLWHLPVYLLVPAYNGAGTGILGIGIPYLQFVVATVASAFIARWCLVDCLAKPVSSV